MASVGCCSSNDCREPASLPHRPFWCILHASRLYLLCPCKCTGERTRSMTFRHYGLHANTDILMQRRMVLYAYDFAIYYLLKTVMQFKVLSSLCSCFDPTRGTLAQGIKKNMICQTKKADFSMNRVTVDVVQPINLFPFALAWFARWGFFNKILLLDYAVLDVFLLQRSKTSLFFLVGQLCGT